MKTQDPERSTTVLKIGGANLERPAYLEHLAQHVKTMHDRGERLVVVHGGGAEIGTLHDSLKVPFRKIDGLRVTSERSMELTMQVLSGSVNKRLVATFASVGLPALGLSGIDLGLLRADLLDEKLYGRVGNVQAVDSERLNWLLDAGLVVVLAPVSLGPDGRPVNVNADTAAHSVATALAANSLDFVSDIPGVRTRADATHVADRLRIAEVRSLAADPTVVHGGMRPKLRAAIAAVEGGVGRVRIGSLSGMGQNQATEIVA
ncbi:MAG: acetylglutamate kinase [Planctomycetota bacterium]